MSDDRRTQFCVRDLLLVTTACAILLVVMRFLNAATIVALATTGAVYALLIFGVVGLRRGVLKTTAADPQSPRRIASVTNDIDAAVLIETLAEGGIRATAVGGYTSGFKAEAPGDVHIVVAQRDAVHAAQLLADSAAGKAPNSDNAANRARSARDS